MTSGRLHGDAAHDHDHRFRCVSLVPLFAALSEKDRHRIAESAVTRRYERGEHVFRAGDRLDLHIVHRGRVKVYRLLESGSEQLIRILGTGEFLGETAVLSETEVDHFAVALDDAEVCSIDRRRILAVLTERPSVAVTMLQTVSQRLSAAEQMVSSLTGRSVEQRLAEHLLQLAYDADSLRFRLPSSKKDLASYLGTTAETLSRRLSALQKAGAIRLGPGRFVEICDEQVLRSGAHAG
ncbi:Crp/Fnr family transcriptional regulator [Rhodococcus sp. NPDC060090]|uniref:Crp/Fnr family transcriptional regulator n=1 Tax=unclassified Rhodococcus (in: high G+C Gram-positive bacteria) TaxID=192944 RepID=UPI0006D24A74|nr:Crp/Fnr family transcriptional regulator [Rhodococcus sp. SMB37]TCN52842.1 CRP/FNR family transcriptional regulator [Rhodococcus sp. SMB37]